MTTTAGMMLVDRIMPMIDAAVARGAVRPVGAEGYDDLRASGVAIAANMLESSELKGRAVTAGNIAHYALQSLKSGRRSGYAGRQDVMCPAAQLDGNVHVASLDEPVGISDEDDQLTLHDSIAASDAEDVDVVVARHLDWDMIDIDARRQAVLRETSMGYGPDEIALHLGVSAPRVVQLRQSCREKIMEAWGGATGIQDAGATSQWRSGMRASAERRAGRAERRG